MTMQDFIKLYQITMTAVSIPARVDGGWPENPQARHWHCTLSRVGYGPGGTVWESVAVEYSQGSAHKKPPTCAEVLDSLATDDTRGASFEDWADDLGYNPDSRKAYATWQACGQSSVKLTKLLGSAAHSDLLNNVERL